MILNIKKILNKIWGFIDLLFSISGYVSKHANLARTISIISVLIFSFYLARYQIHNYKLAFVYFIIAEIAYIGFIYIVLNKNGLRNFFIKKWGEEKGYLVYEAILGFIFINNGISIGYVASATPGNFLDFIPLELLFGIVAIMFVAGFIIKILAAKAVTIDIYYWKDMFLGKKICDFVVTGPYKYLKNPMYGWGQLQAYAPAIWNQSIHGILAAFLNQCLVFSFFYLVEKKFIRRTYLNNK